MKMQIINKLFKLTFLVLLGSMVMISCDKDDDEEEVPPVVVLDGYYVMGAGTGVTSLTDNGLMSVARNEVLQEDRAQLMEIYMAVKGGEAGFNIVMVSGSSQKTYGPGADFAEVTELDNDEPKAGLWRGALAETADMFTVAEDGLYHIAFDSELMIVVIAKVEWGLIGAATPGGWTDDTPLPYTFDLNAMTFEATDVKMTKANWKFRYSGGWKIILDADYDLGGGNTGIKVNCNFGTAVDGLVAGGTDIDNETAAYYTTTMTWTLGGGHAAELTKTGDVEVYDYSATEFGLVGDGLMVGGVQHNWDETIMLHVPTIETTNYTWTYEGVEVTTEGGFKIREGQDWTGLSLGYAQLIWEGLSKDDFEDDGTGNIKPLVDGTYDMVLLIDAANDVFTFTVNPSGVAIPEMYMVGDGTPAGWDIDNPTPMEGTGGEYNITTELPGDGGIKFVTTPGAWQPQYGTELGATWDAGILLVNDGTGTDPEPIPGPPAGTYTITVNTNTMTYTIVAAK